RRRDRRRGGLDRCGGRHGRRFFLLAADQGHAADDGGEQGLRQTGAVHGYVLEWNDGRGMDGAGQAADGSSGVPSPSVSMAGRLITWPGKIRSGSSISARLASWIWRQYFALP